MPGLIARQAHDSRFEREALLDWLKLVAFSKPTLHRCIQIAKDEDRLGKFNLRPTPRLLCKRPQLPRRNPGLNGQVTF